MQRNVDINEISDGKKYTINDMAKIGCNDCSGCSKCCENMKGLITLDPYDIYRILDGLNQLIVCESPLVSNSVKAFLEGKKQVTFVDIYGEFIELSVDRFIIIPTLKMNDKTGKCAFLNENDRCSIHDYRSGICRLFPMGRLYEDGGFYYFLQKDECPYPSKTKVKLKKWLDTKDIVKYEKFVSDWHYFIADIQKYVGDILANESQNNNAENNPSESTDEINQINSALLQIFYKTPYETDFYDEVYLRLEKVRNLLR